MALYSELSSVVTVLDRLREAYEWAKEARHPELQAHLMQARRALLESLQQNLKLHNELQELRTRLAEAEGANEHSRPSADTFLAVTGRGAHEPS